MLPDVPYRRGTVPGRVPAFRPCDVPDIRRRRGTFPVHVPGVGLVVQVCVATCAVGRVRVHCLASGPPSCACGPSFSPGILHRCGSVRVHVSGPPPCEGGRRPGEGAKLCNSGTGRRGSSTHCGRRPGEGAKLCNGPHPNPLPEGEGELLFSSLRPGAKWSLNITWFMLATI